MLYLYGGLEISVQKGGQGRYMRDTNVPFHIHEPTYLIPEFTSHKVRKSNMSGF